MTLARDDIQTFDLLRSETPMPDHAPVYPGYVYICDGVFTRYERMVPDTIAEWKRRDGIAEILRCELFSHEGARLGDRVARGPIGRS